MQPFRLRSSFLRPFFGAALSFHCQKVRDGVCLSRVAQCLVNCLAANPFPLILKRPPPLPNIKIGFRGFHFNIRGVSGAYGYDWDYCS